MGIPEFIEAKNIPVGSNEPQGLIYKIRTLVSSEKVSNFVKVSTNATSTGGTLDALVKWDGVWHSSNSSYAYAQVEFKDRFVFPTHYSLKGASYYYAKEWNLYGFNSECEEPTLLSTNTSIGSTFCGDPSACNNICCSSNWGTFTMNPTDKVFRFFRIKCKTSTTSGSPYRIALSGFEVFGILSKDGSLTKKRKTFCFMSYPLNSHLPTYAFLRLFSVYLS